MSTRRGTDPGGPPARGAAPPKYPILAPEGRVHLVLAGAAAVTATWLWGAWSLPVWLAAGFVLQFFRDPPRRIPATPGAVVSPASGKVVALGPAPSPCQDGRTMLRVSVFMNVFSVHSNLAPVAGEVVDVAYRPGRFVNAALDKSSADNERNTVWIRTGDGQDVHSVQIAGLIARRIFCYVRPGDRVAAGQRYGFIRFGSRVEVYLPPQSAIAVQLGQWVQSGASVLARLPDTQELS